MTLAPRVVGRYALYSLLSLALLACGSARSSSGSGFELWLQRGRRLDEREQRKYRRRRRGGSLVGVVEHDLQLGLGRLGVLFLGLHLELLVREPTACGGAARPLHGRHVGADLGRGERQGRVPVDLRQEPRDVGARDDREGDHRRHRGRRLPVHRHVARSLGHPADHGADRRAREPEAGHGAARGGDRERHALERRSDLHAQPRPDALRRQREGQRRNRRPRRHHPSFPARAALGEQRDGDLRVEARRHHRPAWHGDGVHRPRRRQPVRARHRLRRQRADRSLGDGPARVHRLPRRDGADRQRQGRTLGRRRVLRLRPYER